LETENTNMEKMKKRNWRINFTTLLIFHWKWRELAWIGWLWLLVLWLCWVM